MSSNTRQHHSPAKSIGSRPVALIFWIIGSDNDLGSTTSMSKTNEADQGLRDTKSTLTVDSKKKASQSTSPMCGLCWYEPTSSRSEGYRVWWVFVKCIIYISYSRIYNRVPNAGQGYTVTHFDMYILDVTFYTLKNYVYSYHASSLLYQYIWKKWKLRKVFSDKPLW